MEFTHNDETLNILRHFLCLNKLYISVSDIKLMLETNKSFPTLHSISDTLDLLGIENFSIVAELNDIENIDVPIISVIKSGQDEKYIIIKSIKNGVVHYWNNGNISQNVNDFKEIWTNIVLIIDEDKIDKNKINSTYRKMYISDKIDTFIGIIIFLLLAIIVIDNLMNHDFIKRGIFFMVNIIGIFISGLLLLKENKELNSSIDKFCKFGKHIDCNSVLNYNSPLILGNYTFAEIGISFFFFQLASFILFPNIFPYLLIIAICSLFFTFYSIGIQIFKVGKICIFCCLIVLLLWINFYVISLFDNNIVSISDFNLIEILKLSTIALLSLQIIHLWNSYNNGQKKYVTEKRKFNKFKYDDKLFLLLNTVQPRFSISKHYGYPLLKNNSNINITIFVSFSCTFCAIAFKKMIDIITQYPTYDYYIVFKIDSLKDLPNINAAKRIFSECCCEANYNEILSVINQWYENENRMEIIEDSGNETNVEEQDFIENCIEFQQITKISFTPALFINGVALSKMYSFDDWLPIISQIDK